jgi:DNA-binding CsgD family transcriptional regulator/energy-coupling factor transporter ATP-binding protein EcfA2
VSIELLEREEELVGLRSAAEHVAVHHRGQLVSIVGPAGAGKSTLLEAAAGIARSAGLEVLSARATELESDFAFGIVLQLFERFVAATGSGQRATLFAGAAALSRPLFADSGAHRAREDEGHALSHGVYWLAGNIAWNRAAEPPGGLALLIDDLPLADRASLRTLSYLARRLDDLPVLVVGTARVAGAAASHETAGELLQHPQARRLHPAPLSPAAVARLVRTALGADAEESFCAACARATLGNPFLLHELLAQLQADGVTPSAAVSEVVGQLAPEVVQRSVLRRLAQLTPEAKRLAQAAAVLGDRCKPLMAAALSGLSTEDAMRSADLLRHAEILRECDAMVFSHPLVRAAIESEMPPGERGLAHGRAADLLTERTAVPEKIAVHLLHAPAGDDLGRVRILRRAAERARTRGAQDSAARYLARALEEEPPAPERAELLVQLGEAELACGRPAAIDRLREALTLISEPAERARLWGTLGEALVATGEHVEACGALEQAMSELNDGDDHLCRELRAKFVMIALLSPELLERGIARLERVLESSSGDELPAERVVLAQLAAQRAMGGSPAAETRLLAERAWGDGALLELEGPQGIAWSLVTGALTMAGCYGASVTVSSAVAEEARRRGAPLAAATAAFCRSGPRHRMGQLEEAIADCRQALSARELGWAAYVGAASAVLGLALIDSGELDQAGEVLGLLDDQRFAASSERAPLLDARGWLRLAQNRPAEALVDFQESEQITETFGMRLGFSFWRGGTALAAWQTGDRETALATIEADLDLARAIEAPALIGRALRVKGVVVGGEQGIALLEESSQMLAGSEAALEHVAALVDLGASMRRAGMRAQARDPLHRAVGKADQLGARALGRRAREELRAAGGRLRSGPSSGRDVLTPGERRVAELAALGHTNREIAQALFVTQKAVEWHLANAYRKLEIRSRRELAERLTSDAIVTKPLISS